VIESFASAFAGSDGYVQVVLYSVLPDEVVEAAGSQVSIERCVFIAWFT
jgi:hypothetical protein